MCRSVCEIYFFPKSPEIGFKFSADVKPFVPKYTTVTVAWSEPSEACVFPTTYYPRVQEHTSDTDHRKASGNIFLTNRFLTRHTNTEL
uniref:Uncharacterized protein n=1 Tax=Gopherus agassizii TaxID=38772 RepID=A0A452HSW7_9SAUR